MGSVGLMVAPNWRLSLAIFITVPIVSLARRYYEDKIRKLSRTVQDRLAGTTAVAEEAMAAILVVISLALEPNEISRYNTATDVTFNIARSGGGMSRLNTAFNTAAGASERIFEHLDEAPEVSDASDATQMPVIKGEVRFESVGFRYSEPPSSKISAMDGWMRAMRK